MIIRGLIFFFVTLSILPKLQAQQKGHVEVIKDSLITILQEYRLGEDINPFELKKETVPVGASKTVINKSTATRTSVRGFRVQIYSGSSRSDAYAEQARFKSLYKDVDTYVTYDEPNYRVKVGDFRGRSEASSFMQQLRSQFSNVFIFTENIIVYQ